MSKIENIVKFAKNLWEFNLDYKKRLPLVWYELCDNYDEQTIKVAMIMLYKELDKLDPYSVKEVKSILFNCKMLKNFKIYETNEEVI